MFYKNQVAPLFEVQKKLVAVAMGEAPADTVITNAKLINVCTGQVEENCGVAIACGRVAAIGEISRCIGDGTEVIDAGGEYISPGFMDGHIHIESSMLGVSGFARAVIPHGTVAVFSDPHEMCNVRGKEGLRCMMEDGARTPLKNMVTVPSCVPAVPGFEDTGASICASDVAEMLTWEGVAGLGEMMNYPGIISGTDGPLSIVAETLKTEKRVTGHYPLPQPDAGLDAYIAAGVRTCHEISNAQMAEEKLRRGMYAMLREGSAWCDLERVIPAVLKEGMDTRFALMVTDDAHPHTLVSAGHLDRILKKAVALGLSPVRAVQMVTLNCAQCFKVEDEMGSITPGKCADIVFLSDLASFNVTRVLINGKTVARNGRTTYEEEEYRYPRSVMRSVHVEEITEKSFFLKHDGTTARVRTVDVLPGNTLTQIREACLPVKNGDICADPAQDILKGVVFERHTGTGKKGFGFIRGFGVREGAMASTVSHDAHNLFVVGTNDADMALAAKTLADCGGGMVVVRGGKLLGLVELPIAGLMSEKSAEEMDKNVAALSEAWREIGCVLPSPFMTMSVIPLACIPYIRLTDRGLVDCVSYEFLPLVLD